jgi:hypothetical protein
MALASTFTTVLGVATFGTLINGVSDKQGSVRQLDVNLYFGTIAAFELILPMVSYDVTVTPIPWAPVGSLTVEVISKGGPGVGTLVIPGFGSALSYAAYLTSVERSQQLKGGRVIGRGSFLITG